MRHLSVRSRWIVTVAACFAVSGAAVAQSGRQTRSLVVLATTDVHGRLRGWDYYDARPDSAHSLAAAATIVDSIRRANVGNVILVDAGDLLQGNPLTTLASRAPESAVHPVIGAMNAMRYDAAAVGNHEFNYGVPLFRRAIARARFPFLSANAMALQPAEALPAFTLVKRGDLTVGVIGATTPGVMVWDRDNVRGRLTFGDIVPALRTAAAQARRAGADLVIAVVHAGLDGAATYDTVATGLPGENVVARVPREVPGLDLVVYGHSHREMVDTTIAGVRLIQPRPFAGSVAVATLALTRVRGRWTVSGSTGRSVPVAGHVESPAVLAAIDSVHRGAVAAVAESIGVTRESWRADRARAVDLPITDLVGEVMRRVSGAQLAASPAFSLDVTIDSGTVTAARIAKLYPYDNTLRAVRVSGRQLRAFLEHSAKYWNSWTAGSGATLVNRAVPGFNFDMLVGANYEIDLTKPVGQRITALTYEGRSVAETDSFTLALSSYRQTGGGGYTMLAGAPVVYESKGDIREMIVDAIRTAGKLSKADWGVKNWRIVPSAAETAALASLTTGSRQVSASTVAPYSGITLRVIGLNDFHGAFESRKSARGQQFGGAGALATAIRGAAASCRPPSCYSVIVDGGDQFQGTPASNLAYGRTVVTLLDSLGVTAAALGNHEFDYGQDSLRARLRQASYPVLSANLRDTLGNVPAWIRQDVLVRRGPLTIGIIGVSTIETPKTTRAINVADLRFIDPAPVVSARARALRAAGADVIIVTGHVGGFCNDDGACDGEIFELVNRLTAPVDLVVSGHSHSYLNTRLRGVPIVQARSRGEAIDVVDLAVGDTAGRSPTDMGWSRVLRADVLDVMSDTLAADPQAARITSDALRAVTAIIDQPVGRIVSDMRRDGSQYALGNLVADAMREAAESDIAIMNNGGIRANLLAGDVNFGRLYEVQPFGNTLVRLRVRGVDLQRYLNRLLAGRDPRVHVSGITIRYDKARRDDDRIVELRIGDAPVDPARIYSLTMNDFMFTGGDGLGLAGLALDARELKITDIEAVVAYVRARPAGVTAPAVDRIRLITP